MSLGRYDMVRPLAASGMAELHLARVRDSERTVVIKRLRPELASRPAVVERFLSEARIGAALAHRNIVRVEEIVDGPEDWYYVTEHLAGANLLDCMKVLTMQGRAMPIECAVAIGIDVCAGLAFAHVHRDASGSPIVHRNVSPLNVLLGYDGTIKLGHFGLEGTLGYMSPEQCLGETVDARSDVFALGVVLYEVATGRRLFGSREPEDRIRDRILSSDIVPPSQHRSTVPQALEDVILRALQRERADRYPDALELQRGLEGCLWNRQPARSAVGDLVRRALHESPAFGTRIIREEDMMTVVRSTSPEVMAIATRRPPSQPEAPGPPIASPTSGGARSNAERCGGPIETSTTSIKLGWRLRPRVEQTGLYKLARSLPNVATEIRSRLVMTWRWARRWPVAVAAVAVVLGLGVSGWLIGRTSHVPAALPAVMTTRPAPPVIPPIPPRGHQRGTGDAASRTNGAGTTHKLERRRARR